jgi:hypothetical protein
MSRSKARSGERVVCEDSGEEEIDFGEDDEYGMCGECQRLLFKYLCMGVDFDVCKEKDDDNLRKLKAQLAAHCAWRAAKTVMNSKSVIMN